MKFRLSLIFLLVAATLADAAPPTDEQRRSLRALFDSAAQEFGVPADILKGIAFAETRWTHLTWPDGETVSPCNGKPRAFGVMSLWDNDIFGHSLIEAAALLKLPPDTLKLNPAQNIRGAAALLKNLYAAHPLPEGTAPADLESWRNAIAGYCGIAQPDLAQQHALDIYSVIESGYAKHGIELPARPVKLTPLRTAVRAIQAKHAKPRPAPAPADGGFTPAAQPDYPGAIWRPAYPGHWNTTGNARAFVVIHDMEGYYLSTISYFQRATTEASAHFCINGLKDYASDAEPGEVTQMVEERHWAWHARCWNSWSLGIEHEGFVDDPAWYTEAQYQASASLTRYLCDKYGIPKDRNHIIAHGQKSVPGWIAWMNSNWPQIDPTCNNHTDPGANWDWPHYMALVIGNTNLPPAIDAQPTNVVMVLGGVASFTVTVTNSTSVNYRWSRNGVPLSTGGRIHGATTAMLSVSNVQPADAAFYSVTITNTGGSVTSSAAQILLAATPAPAGTGTGLRALVFDNADFTSLKRARIDATVNFDWAAGAPSSTTDADTFSVRWHGQVQPRHTQTYTFHTTTDDGVRLWVNGILLIDKWLDQGATEWTAAIALNAGQKYNLRLDYFENTDGASARLWWSSASQAKEIIPATQLYRPPPALAAPASAHVTAGMTVTFPLTATNADPILSAQPLADFNDYADGQADVMFRAPAYSGSTAANLDPAETNYTSILAVSPAGNASAASLKARWAFATNANSPWLRLTTANTPALPNPAIDFSSALWFDIHADRPVRVALGIRETGTTTVLGGDGGQNGTIEFIGATNVTAGQPMPVRLVAANVWTTLAFDPLREPARAFTGNGILSSTNNRGALEHIAIIPALGSGVYRVHLDNFVSVTSNALAFSLLPGAPAGASVHATNGIFSWAIPPAQAPGVYTLCARVTDSGSPSLSATQTFTITVAAPPQLQISAGADGAARLQWNSVSGAVYRVQYKSTLEAPAWNELPPVTAPGPQTLFTNSPAPALPRFYRLRTP